MKINGVEITDLNLEDYYEFSEEEFLGRTEIWCGVCDGQGEYISSVNNKLEKCFECDGTGEITDETNPDHSCLDWDSDDIDFDYEEHASIDRTCPTCHQLSRLHFWRKE
jgi:DnaJ-class molecular chaperone